MLLDELDVPVVLAPLAGGPSTPGLAAAVSGAGGLGFLATGYLTAAESAARLAATRALTRAPVGVNVFVPGPRAADPEPLRRYVDSLAAEAAAAGVALGTPSYDDDDWAAKLDLLAGDPPPVVSFTFGCPPAAELARLRAAGSEVWVTVTSPAEARAAAAAGADVLVVQGAEAGGHQARFVDDPHVVPAPLGGLLAEVRAAADLPLVATGGLMTAAAVARALRAGAAAAQLGSAFLLCPEAGTTPVHRAAVASTAPTALTRAFTGRLARGVVNRFMTDHDEAPVAYPQVHHLTAPLRRAGRERHEADLVNLWAGTNHHLAEPRPAADLVAALAAGLAPGGG